MSQKDTGIKSMTLAEFRAALKAQGVATHMDFAFVCPMCKTVQSARDLIANGAGADMDSVEKYLGFSCFGRWTKAGSPRTTPDGKPCNWTLGGLISVHNLEILTPDGARHPHFEIATPEQAQEHAATATPA